MISKEFLANFAFFEFDLLTLEKRPFPSSDASLIKEVFELIGVFCIDVLEII